MPDITANTPRTPITIAGQTFNVPQPYAAGHELNANEASALNQTYAENVRNNQAKAVKAELEAGTFSVEVFQAKVDDYCDGYEFGVRTGGGRTGDPVLSEAMDITRDLVRKALAKQISAGTLKDAEGAAITKLSDVAASRISELAKGVLARGDDKAAQIMATARQRVTEAQGIDEVEIDSLGGAEPEAPKGKKKVSEVPEGAQA